MELTIRFADASALSDPARFAAAYAAVPAQRRDKIDRLRSPAARRLSLAAGLLLQQALGDAGVAPEDMLFDEGPYGKPFLPRRPDVQFSLSHSAASVMCVTADRPVGCDIQLISPRGLRIAERRFTEEERQSIFAEPSESARQATFCRIWTLKESFLKCTGLGLAMPLNAFSVFPEGDRIVFRPPPEDAGHYTFSEPDAGEGYRSACCIRES